jgi:F0F1-type ATP synthase assembly protein I
MQQASAAAVGLEFGLSIALGAWLGSLFDGRFQTSPWGVLSGIVLGATSGFRSLYRFARQMEAEEERAARPDPPSAPPSDR